MFQIKASMLGVFIICSFFFFLGGGGVSLET